MHKRNGDTLIEVTLAVGIFSLVAIAVVAVVNNSTSGAQTALETTLAREEIDTQAEALRFIQSSYINSETVDETTDTSDPQFKYKQLWDKITKLAKTPTEINSSGDLSYRLETCQKLYTKEADGSNRILHEGAFIINPQKIGISTETSGWENQIIISSTKSKANLNKFTAASTYPHIVYGTSNATESLADDSSNQGIYKIEGFYVIAIEGPKTLVVSEKGGTVLNALVAAYYDFYIRSCWYESGATTPTTVSTLMRLYNPDVVKLYPKED